MVSDEELAAVAEGIADTATERRVLLAALRDPAIKARLRHLEEAAPSADDPIFAERAERLRDALRATVAQVADETAR